MGLLQFVRFPRQRDGPNEANPSDKGAKPEKVVGTCGAEGSLKESDLGVATKPRSADPGLGSIRVEADGNPPYQLVEL